MSLNNMTNIRKVINLMTFDRNRFGNRKPEVEVRSYR
jgi:hypothetical protein